LVAVTQRGRAATRAGTGGAITAHSPSRRGIRAYSMICWMT
jgi:hypothetical protein